MFEHPPWISVFIDDETEQAPGCIRIREGDGRPGAAVLALADDSVAMVKVHRRVLRRAVWELPRGFADLGESSADAARRELLEETGIAIETDDLRWLGRVAPNSGLLESEVELYVVHVPPDTPLDPEDRDEVRAAAWIPIAEVLDRTRSGEIVDSFTLAAIAQALLKGMLTDTTRRPD